MVQRPDMRCRGRRLCRPDRCYEFAGGFRENGCRLRGAGRYGIAFFGEMDYNMILYYYIILRRRVRWCRRGLRRGCGRSWEANMRNFARRLTGRCAPGCGGTRSSAALRAIWRGFRSRLCRGARRGFIMTRPPGPDCRRITQLGFTIYKSPAPWLRRSLWTRSRASACSTCARPPAGNRPSWRESCRGRGCWCAMRSMPSARRSCPGISSGWASPTRWF